MSAAVKKIETRKVGPVRALPMPPIKVQKPDSSGNSALSQRDPTARFPIPHLVLNLRAE